MPLSKLGQKMKLKLIKEYGKTKGTSVFYAMERKHPKWTKGR